MRVGLLGSNQTTGNQIQFDFAEKLGKALIDNGFSIINGGMAGTMESAAKGAKSSNNYTPDKMIAILPVSDKKLGNPYSGTVLVTDMGTARNRLIVINSDAVIAIGGGAGTLNEITLAWEMLKPIGAFVGGSGWSEKMAGLSIDSRRTDSIQPVNTIEEAIKWLNELKK
jgi:hypothetical protein